MFRRIHRGAAVHIFSRRGFLRNDVNPGLSDIDLLYIFDESTGIKRHLNRVCKYLFLTPLVVEVEYMDRKSFSDWVSGNEFRSLEFRAAMKKDNFSLKITSEEAFFFSSVKEVFNLYQYLLRGLSTCDRVFKNYIIMKHIVDIHRVIYFYRERNWGYLTMKRRDLFNKKINREKEIKNFFLVKNFELYLSDIFQEIKLFSKMFLEFLGEKYSIKLSKEEYLFLYNTNIFGREVLFSNHWPPHAPHQIPLSEEMFKALKASAVLDHDVVNIIIKKFNQGSLKQWHLQRIYAGLNGGNNYFEDETAHLLYLS